MKKFVVMAAATAAAVSMAASAQAQVKYNAQGRSSVSHTQPAAAPAKAKFKPQMAYYYTRGFGTDTSIGVDDFQHPSTGIYCILPHKPIKANSYPQIGIEWDQSLGFGLWAYWKDTAVFSDCPSGYQEVTTYDLESGAAVLSDNVAFDILIP
ncbi:MAG: hypothetical protein JO056_01990 [Alphaproteobacteria bacterium]|nr:hypothetical protein [Alphaproteobacteria bacterium]